MTPPAHTPPPTRIPLTDATLGHLVTVAAVQTPAGAPEWAGQLCDLGFVPGEPVRLMARGLGGDPLVVRVGHSTYALRRAEAACVWVVSEAAPRG